MEQLKKRGFQLANRCPLCGATEEKISHMLSHSHSVWREGLIPIPGSAWVCLFLIKDLFMSWNWFPLRKKARIMWMAAFLCLIWAIWKERIHTVFEDEAFSLTRSKASLISSLISWARLIDVGECSFIKLLLRILCSPVGGKFCLPASFV